MGSRKLKLWIALLLLSFTKHFPLATHLSTLRPSLMALDTQNLLFLLSCGRRGLQYQKANEQLVFNFSLYQQSKPYYLGKELRQAG